MLAVMSNYVTYLYYCGLSKRAHQFSKTQPADLMKTVNATYFVVRVIEKGKTKLNTLLNYLLKCY